MPDGLELWCACTASGTHLMFIQQGQVWSIREHAPDMTDYAVMWLEAGAVFCNVYTSDSEGESQLQAVPQNIEQPLSCQCTATRHKFWETPLDLSVHEDSPEKVVRDMYIKPSIT